MFKGLKSAHSMLTGSCPHPDQSKKPQQSSDTQVNPEDIDEVDSEGQNIILGIISQLRFGSDLSRITLPTFILERKSMLERITNQFQHPYILLEAHETKDPIERFLNVVKWSLSGWHITPKAVKKPLNPVLGEYFSSYWELPNGTKAFYIAEQTSHHPPKSSYFYMSPENYIRIDGTLIPRARFLGNSVASMMEGEGYLQFLDIIDPKTGKPELYEITQPNMYARGILIGKLKYELGDHSIIKCPSLDLIADIEFKTKGFVSGTYNAIHGEVKRISSGKVLYEITGKWNEVMEIKDMATGKKSVFFDTKTAKPSPPIVRPIEEQGPLESRRLWSKVCQALSKMDHQAATTEKSAIEDQQRHEAKLRADEGIDFHPKLFKRVKEPIQYRIYKRIDGKTPQEQIEQILSIMPVLPGQEFSPNFEIPGYKKHKEFLDVNHLLSSDGEDEGAAAVPTQTAPANPAPVPVPETATTSLDSALAQDTANLNIAPK